MKSLMGLILILFSSFAQADTITIGSKNFTEQAILGEIMAQLIEEKTDLKVERKFFLGGTQFTFNAIQKGDIDIYPSYTGTAYIAILKQSQILPAHQTFLYVQKEYLKQFNLVWLKPFGFNNTYGFGVLKSNPRFQNIQTLSQIRSFANELKFGGPHEFLERPDGFSGLQKAYQLKFLEFVGLDPGLMYQAVVDGQVDVISAFTTDGRIQKFGIQLLEDDLNFFPPYFAAPLIRKSTLEKHPKLKGVLNLLAGRINDDLMMKMNHAVDLKSQPLEDVAQWFLVSEGLVAGSLPASKLNQRAKDFWNYALSQKDYVFSLTLEHLALVAIALFFAMLVGLPTGILLTRVDFLSGPIFALVNILQTIPSLALLGFLIPFLGIGKTPAIVALFLYALLPLVRNTYTGIKDVSPQLIEVSKGMGLTGFQTLRHVELPLALPTIMAGIRISTVIMVGTATLAALIGAGGLGDPIFRGISSVNHNLILLGAIPSALLAIVLDRFLLLVQKLVQKG